MNFKDWFSVVIAPMIVALTLYTLSSVIALESKTNVNEAINNMIVKQLEAINIKIDRIINRGCE